MEEVLRIQWFAGYNTYNLFAPCAGGVPRYAATNKDAKEVKSQDEEPQEAPHAIILDDGDSEVYAGTSNVKEAEGIGLRKGKDENLHRQVLSELDDLIEETEGEVRKALLHPLLSLQQLHAQSNVSYSCIGKCYRNMNIIVKHSIVNVDMMIVARGYVFIIL